MGTAKVELLHKTGDFYESGTHWVVYCNEDNKISINCYGEGGIYTSNIISRPATARQLATILSEFADIVEKRQKAERKIGKGITEDPRRAHPSVEQKLEAQDIRLLGKEERSS